MKPTILPIFDYTDYRLYLKDYYEEQKQNGSFFSYRYFARKSGVAASVYKDIVEGRRRLTIPVMEKYAKAMNLSAKETEYFDALVKFNNSTKVDDQNEALLRMNRLRKKSSLKFLEKNQYEFFSQWYHSVIRELVTLPSFKEDYVWIAKKVNPPITPAQAKRSLKLLEVMGLIKRNEKGKLEITDAAIASEFEAKSIALRHFHQEMISLARDSIENYSPEKREVSSLTLGISDICYFRVKKRIQEFKEELLNMVVEDKSSSNLICQLNFQLFPLINDSE